MVGKMKYVAMTLFAVFVGVAFNIMKGSGLLDQKRFDLSIMVLIGCYVLACLTFALQEQR
jgi:hypothetical protein